MSTQGASACDRWMVVVAGVAGLEAIGYSALLLVTRTRWSLDAIGDDLFVPLALAVLGLGVGAVSGSFVWLWSTQIRHRRAVVAATVLFALLVLLVVVGTHADVQLGQLPAWVSAVGAVFTAGGVLLAVQSYLVQQRDALEEQANQARLVKVSYRPAGLRGGKYTWLLIVQNWSDEPVFNISVVSFRAQVEDGGPSVALRAIENLEFNGEVVGTISAHTRRIRLDGNETFEVRWAADDEAKAVPAAVVQLTLMDAKGRYWLITDNYEPEKITKKFRPVEDRLKSPTLDGASGA